MFSTASLRSQNAHGHFTRAILCRNLQGKCRTLISRPMFCASLRSQNAHGHFTRAILCRNLEGKCRTLISRPVYCASLRSQNAHGHFTRAILCRNLQGKCRTLISRPVFCVCAVEMHMDISQEPFHGEIYRENAGRARYHLDQTPGLNTYRKNPSVWPHCLGKNNTPKKKSLKNAKEKIGRKNKKHARLCCVALDFWFVFSVCFGCAPRSLSIFLCNPTLCLLGSSSHAFQLFNFFQPRWLHRWLGHQPPHMGVKVPRCSKWKFWTPLLKIGIVVSMFHLSSAPDKYVCVRFVNKICFWSLAFGL